jgi:hypothetical protein
VEPRARVAERPDKTIVAEMRDDVGKTPGDVIAALNCSRSRCDRRQKSDEDGIDEEKRRESLALWTLS